MRVTTGKKNNILESRFDIAKLLPDNLPGLVTVQPRTHFAQHTADNVCGEVGWNTTGGEHETKRHPSSGSLQANNLSFQSEVSSIRKYMFSQQSDTGSHRFRYGLSCKDCGNF